MIPLLEAVELAGKALALGGTLWASKPYVIEPLVAVSKRLIRVFVRIEYEFGENGGGSMRDRVATMTTSLTQIVHENRQQSARLMALMGAMPYPIFETCDEGRFTFANRALEHLTGLSLAQLEGMGWVNAIHGDDREAFLTKWEHAVKDQREFVEACRFVRRTDGRLFWVTVSANPKPENERPAGGGWHGHVDHDPRQGASA